MDFFNAEKSRLSSLATEAVHIHGLRRVSIHKGEAVVLCVVKDGENLAQAFIEHYLSLGFKHLFFLDNGSTDGTIDITSRYKQTTVLSSQLPFKDYYVTFKNFLIQMFGCGSWCVVADIDELLLFPRKQRLIDVLGYLNRHDYNVVVVQMLDVFSKEGIPLTNRAKAWTLNQLKETFFYYDLNHLRRERPVRVFQSRFPKGLDFLYGGIRKTVFNQDCFLTKEALFFADKSTRLKSSHLLKRSAPADFSALFLHYKFIDSFYATTVNAVEAENHWQNSKEYKAYLAVLDAASNATSEQKLAFSLFQPSSRILKDVDDLIDEGFLFTSKRFLADAGSTVKT